MRRGDGDERELTWTLLSEQLRRWVVIDQAVGVLMVQLGVDREAAMRALMADSVRGDVSVHAAACRLLERV